LVDLLFGAFTVDSDDDSEEEDDSDSLSFSFYFFIFDLAFLAFLSVDSEL
jgi:hypothetical protein